MPPSYFGFDTHLFPLCRKTQEQQQGGVTDEAEPFMGSGRFGNFCFFTSAMIGLLILQKYFIHLVYVYVAARAYLLGYNCADEKELNAALRFC